jgi:acetyl esterase/lipase
MAAALLLAVLVTATLASPASAATRNKHAASARSASRRAITGAYRIDRNLVYRTIDGQVLTLDAYLPLDANGATLTNRAAVVLLHGGAWVEGDKDDMASLGRRLAADGYVAVSVNYRLAPEFKYPDAVDDVQAAVAWLRGGAQIERLGVDPARIGVLGASAGGYLAAMVGTMGSGALDQGDRVAVVVSWSGITDLNGIYLAGFGEAQLGCAVSSCSDLAAAASPITHVDGHDAPMLLVNASDDPITPIAQATTMATTLARYGVHHEVLDVPGTLHGTQLEDAAWTATMHWLARYLAA